MEHTIEEIGARMDALNVWDVAGSCYWALKPRGCAFPYFCSALKGERPTVKTRFVLLEGWQTFHDMVRSRMDPDFGFYSLPIEFTHFELVVLRTGERNLIRYDTGYAPREANARERAFCTRMLWEAYGVMLRLETDPKLPLMFADDKAMFSRVEQPDGSWRDMPLEIPEARPHVEQITFEKKAIAAAKALPMRTDEILELDFRVVPTMRTLEKVPRTLYLLAAVDAKTGDLVFRDKLSMDAETGLKGLWEGMPPRVLAHILARGGMPGELRVQSGRVFRLIRPLCLQMPFKLTRVSNLPHFGAALENLV